MKWNYEGFDRNGRPQKGKLDALNRDEAREQLTARGLTITKISASQELTMPWENRPPSLKDRAMFTQSLSQYIGGATPIAEALGAAGRAATNPRLRQAVEEIRNEVNKGVPLAEVIARPKYSSTFDPVFVAFIKLGTAAGSIERPLNELSEMYKWQLKIQGSVKKALTLPGIIALACVVVTYFIMARVVPTFMGILDGLHAPLPALTKVVKEVSTVAANPLFTLTVIASIVGLVFFLQRYHKTEEGRYRLDRLLLNIPVAGPLARTFILARVSRSIAVMQTNGIPLPETLTIASDIAANEIYRRYFLEMRRVTVLGDPMWPVMANAAQDFPEQYWFQFRAAEEAKHLRRTLSYLGDVYNDEVTAAVESLTVMIEPFLMIFLGGFVGVILVSVFLPMSSMMQALEH